MAGDQLVTGTRWNESQFQGGHTALCGPNALAMAESWGAQSYVNTLTVYNRMHAAGRCDSNGAATIDSLETQAHADGFTRTEKIGFTGSGIAEATWRHFLAQHAGAAVIIVETLNGQALRDLISGQGEDAQRLQRHFFGIYGLNDGTQPSALFARRVPAGYIVSDGCNNLLNPIVGGVRQRVLAGHQQLFYPYALVRSSRPAALLAIYPKPSTAASSTPAQETPQQTPQQTIVRQYQEILALRQQVYRQNDQIAQLQGIVTAVRKVLGA